MKPIKSGVSSINDLAGKYLKPYQGLKPANRRHESWRAIAGKYLKPYQGLKRRGRAIQTKRDKAGKYLKPYQGLKQNISYPQKSLRCRKIPKTLSGIETGSLVATTEKALLAGKYLKPYQGLKHIMGIILKLSL